MTPDEQTRKQHANEDPDEDIKEKAQKLFNYIANNTVQTGEGSIHYLGEQLKIIARAMQEVRDDMLAKNSFVQDSKVRMILAENMIIAHKDKDDLAKQLKGERALSDELVRIVLDESKKIQQIRKEFAVTYSRMRGN